MTKRIPEKPDKIPVSHSEPDKDPVHFPPLTMDWREFAHFLEDSDLTDDQKREFIETVTSIVVAFIDLGLGSHPVQQVTADTSSACEQNREIQDFITTEYTDMIKLPPNHKFNRAASVKSSDLAQQGSNT